MRRVVIGRRVREQSQKRSPTPLDGAYCNALLTTHATSSVWQKSKPCQFSSVQLRRSVRSKLIVPETLRMVDLRKTRVFYFYAPLFT